MSGQPALPANLILFWNKVHGKGGLRPAAAFRPLVQGDFCHVTNFFFLLPLLCTLQVPAIPHPSTLWLPSRFLECHQAGSIDSGKVSAHARDSTRACVCACACMCVAMALHSLSHLFTVLPQQGVGQDGLQARFCP